MERALWRNNIHITAGRRIPLKPSGVTLGWGDEPRLVFREKDGSLTMYFFPDLDKKYHPEYWVNEIDWPIEPKTGKKLSIIKAKDPRPLWVKLWEKIQGRKQ